MYWPGPPTGEERAMATAVPSVGPDRPTAVVRLIDDTAAARQPQPHETDAAERIDASELDKLVAAFVRIRSVDQLDGAIISRCWLAADMGADAGDLDRLLKLLRWHGLIGLPNAHLVTVDDPAAMREIALAGAAQSTPLATVAAADSDAPDGHVAA